MPNESQSSSHQQGADQNPVLAATKWLKELTALLAALGGLGGALGPLLFQDEKDQNLLWIGISAAVAFAGLSWLARRWLAPPSTLRKPSALDIGCKYLRGRDTDLDNLLGRLKDFPLVWLVGESGAGKSSLLVRGLVPRLEEEKSFFPVYLEHWGADWQEGPCEGLCRTLNETLDEPAREKLGLKESLTVDQIGSVLGRIKAKLAQTPILIFDQFDDYQTRHWKRFLRGDERKLVPVSTLRRENTFWKDIAGLLEAGKVRCLFVTRADMQWGLECVRFGEPEIYPLDRLGRAYASELLDEITADDVVAAPERGWDGLKKRLLDDLGKDGWVLPIRMKFAFRGLRGLRALSVGHYEREGGLPGLEALDVKGYVAQAARLSSLKEDNVRRLLLKLVEPEAQGKTVPRTIEQLLAVVPEAESDEGRLVQALRNLQDADILRQRIDPDQEGATVWLLYHDYLCRGVVELDRRARRWQTKLEEAMRAFEKARGIVGRWRALLPPVVQLRFGYAWLRGQLRYGAASRFAATSTLRLVANVWVLALVLGFFGWSSLDARQDAQDLFYAFTLKSTTSPDEAEALWRLSRERKGVREAFYGIIFSKSRNAERFLKKNDHILQATLGLSTEHRRRLLVELVEGNCHKGMAEEHLAVCLDLLNILPLNFRGALGEELLSEATDNASNRTVTVTDYHEWWSNSLARGLGDFCNSQEATDNAAFWIVAFIDQIQDEAYFYARGLVNGVGTFDEELSPGAAENAFHCVVKIIAQTQLRSHLSDLASGLEALVERLPMEAVDIAAQRIVEVMAQTQDYRKLDVLARGLGALGERLPSEAADDAVNRIIEVMAHIQDNQQLSSLAGRLEAFGKKISPEVADNTANQIVEIMTQTPSEWRLKGLAIGLGNLGEKLPPETADSAANRIIEVMAQTKYKWQLEALAIGLGALGKQLRENSVESSLRVLLGTFRPLTEPPCASARSLIRNNKDNLEAIVDLLKWPTCSSEDRDALIQQVGQVTGESFKTEWDFIQWANTEGYDLERPPQDPEPLETVLEELTRR